MGFMGKQEAEALAKQIQSDRRDVEVQDVFPASYLDFNKERYPPESYLISIMIPFKSASEKGGWHEYIENEEHWDHVNQTF